MKINWIWMRGMMNVWNECGRGASTDWILSEDLLHNTTKKVSHGFVPLWMSDVRHTKTRKDTFWKTHFQLQSMPERRESVCIKHIWTAVNKLAHQHDAFRNDWVLIWRKKEEKNTSIECLWSHGFMGIQQLLFKDGGQTGFCCCVIDSKYAAVCVSVYIHK